MKKICAVCLALALSFTVVYSQTIRVEFPFTDGTVSAIVKFGNAIYIGGNFRTLKYSSGASYARQNLAAFDANTGSILPWNPKMPVDYNSVWSLAIGNNSIYVGGFFGTIGDSIRTNLAALDLTTGKATGWKPDLLLTYGDPLIFKIRTTESKVYLAGAFSRNVGNSDNIITLDAVTGQIVPGFSYLSDYPSLTLVLKDSTLFVGGVFTKLGIVQRQHIAVLNATTGEILPWNPYADSVVWALAVKDNIVYAGGLFRGFGYDPVNKSIAVQRRGAAALDAATGAVLPWNPNVEGDVRAVTVDRNNIYLGGSFISVGGQSRNNIVMVNAVTAEVSSWNANADRTVQDILVDGNTVFVGGDFTSIAGQSRSFFAALTAPANIPNCLVNDNQAPSINNTSTSVTEIWPANKKMKDVSIDYTTTDNCPAAVTTELAITSNEQINTGDWKIIDNHHIQLKAERSGNGNGRIYTITLTAIDQAGNKATKSTTVLVPHDQGKNINVRTQEDQLIQNAELFVKAQLNPSRSYFTLTTRSSNTSQKINLRLYDISGRLLEVKNVSAGQSVQMGKTLNRGVYLLAYSQAGLIKQTKLIKQ